MHIIDLAIIAIYATAMIALGWFTSRRQRNTKEYFTGSGQMNPILIGVSLFATLLSTISYLASPGEIIRHGPLILSGVISIPLGYLIVGYLLIPVFMQYRLTSAYELLEKKLGVSTRLLGASMFITLRLMWMAVLLNFAANALLVTLGWQGDQLFIVTVVIGSIALAYSTLGGLRAVVITDFVQFVLLFGGAVLVIIVATVRIGGFGWIPTGWDPAWKSQPIVTLDPYVRLSFLGVVMMQLLWTVCTAGSDQTAIQRFMAVKDVKAARRSYLVNSIAGLSVLFLLAIVGLALMGFYRTFPFELRTGQTIESAADKLFPQFIADQLPIGITGLVLSGMFAAAMSSIDSGVNSISAVVLCDFVDRFRGRAMSSEMQLRIARLIALGVGAIVIAGSLLIEWVPGNLMVVSKRVTGLLVTPLFTLFILALFVRFTTARGANAGAIVGFLTALMVSFWNPLIATRSLSVTWIHPIALLVGCGVGCAVSYVDGCISMNRFRLSGDAPTINTSAMSGSSESEE